MNLTSDTSYLYYICAYDDQSNEACSLISARTLLPENPTDLIANEITQTSIKLEWQAHSTDFEFRIRAANHSIIIDSLPIGTVDYTLTGLTLGTDYLYKVCAYKGAEEYCSELFYARTADLPIPTNVSNSAITKNSIALTWTDNATTETKYWIKRDGIVVKSDLLADSIAYIDTLNLQPNATYIYQICAIDDTDVNNVTYGCSFPYSVTTSPLVPPLVSINLAASNQLTPTTIKVDWLNTDNSVTGFKVKYEVGNTIGEVNASSSTSHTILGLDENTTYLISVCAINNDGETCTNQFYGYTDSKPLIPSNITFSDLTNASMTLSWADNSNKETGYRVKQVSPSSNFTDLASGTTSHVFSGLLASTTYSYQICAIYVGGENCSVTKSKITNPNAPSALAVADFDDESVSITWSDNDAGETGHLIKRGESTFTVGSNETGYVDNNVTHSTLYNYEVCAVNNDGESCSSSISVTTNFPSPKNVGIILNSQDEVDLSWTGHATAVSFVVERDATPLQTPVPAQANAGPYVYQDLSVSDSTSYQYKICAINNAGDQSCTKDLLVALSVTTPISKPIAPSNVVVNFTSETSADITWVDNAATETQYRIRRGSRLFTIGSDLQTYTDNSVRAGVTYTYKVCAYNSGGESCTLAPAQTAPGQLLILTPIINLLFN